MQNMTQQDPTWSHSKSDGAVYTQSRRIGGDAGLRPCRRSTIITAMPNGQTRVVVKVDGAAIFTHIYGVAS
jgi:hypothetical protein